MPGAQPRGGQELSWVPVRRGRAGHGAPPYVHISGGSRFAGLAPFLPPKGGMFVLQARRTEGAIGGIFEHFNI